MPIVFAPKSKITSFHLLGSKNDVLSDLHEWLLIPIMCYGIGTQFKIHPVGATNIHRIISRQPDESF